MSSSRLLSLALGSAFAFTSAGCRSAGERVDAGDLHRPDSAEPVLAERPSDEIVVASRRFHIGAPVVLWTDPGGYSAYVEGLFFGGEPKSDSPRGSRYRPGRTRGDPGRGHEPLAEAKAPTIGELRDLVDQFVLHYDVCGVSRTCFKVLHDIRGLSVHFLLDIDGTLYQTLDLADTAWHATIANSRSIGIEIANIGAYPAGTPSLLDEWYAADERGTFVRIPERLGDGGVRTKGFVGRPAHRDRIRGVIQGLDLEMYDYTPQQYDSLVRLAAALCSIFPTIAADAPRDAEGSVRRSVLSPGELAGFRGILGHYHVQENKQDPGPAFDWERFLRRVRILLWMGAPEAAL